MDSNNIDDAYLVALSRLEQGEMFINDWFATANDNRVNDFLLSLIEDCNSDAANTALRAAFATAAFLRGFVAHEDRKNNTP